MKTEAEIKLEQITNEILSLKTQDKLKADVAYTHLTSIIKWLIATIVIMIVCFAGLVMWVFNNFDVSVEDLSIDAGYGNANYIEGERNEINNGTNN